MSGRNGIHIEEWRRGNCVVQQQSGTSFGTLYAALILHRIGNNHPTAGVKRDPVITVTVNLSRNLHEQVAASADTYTPAEARGQSAFAALGAWGRAPTTTTDGRTTVVAVCFLL
jgi:hypothetical protein